MHTVLQRLHRDHEHIDRVLNLLEQQIDAFHEGQPIDFELISNVLHYMADYADQVHHRLEDQLFDPLKDRSDPIGAPARASAEVDGLAGGAGIFGHAVVGRVGLKPTTKGSEGPGRPRTSTTSQLC